MFRARRRCKILAGVLVKYVEDDFMPTTQLWTIAADRSRTRILQLALIICKICNVLESVMFELYVFPGGFGMKRNICISILIISLLLVFGAKSARVCATEFEVATAPVSVAVIDTRTAVEDITRAKTMIESENAGADELKMLIGHAMHVLRGPLPNGKGYHLATVDMGDDVENTNLMSVKIDAIWELGQKKTITAELSSVYKFIIYSPLHRGFFKNNGNFYLDSYTVEYTINGITESKTVEYKDWITRDSTLEVPLPGIAEWAKLELVVGVEPADVNNAILQIYARQPVVDDDPKNPFSYSISMLAEAKDRIEIGRRLKEIEKFLDEALLGIKVAKTYAADASVVAGGRGISVQELERILYLLEGNALENDEGVEELKTLLEKQKK